jgi:alpha-L-rhamnosidase
MERVYPFPGESRFESDDPTLDGVFHICRRTLAMSGQEWITDSAWRESANWLGDASAVSVGGLHACFAETATTGKFLREAAGSQTASGLISQVISLPAGGPTGNLPDYSLYWIEALYRHYLLTGEAAWARDFYPQVRRVLDYFEPYRDGTGLIADLDVATFCDWAPVDGCGYHLGRTEGAHAFLNALYHRALASAIELARANDDSATVDRLQQRRDAIAGSYVDRLYDAQAGLIADTVRGDRRSERFSEQCNAMALAAGVLDDELARQVIERAFVQPVVELTEAQPFCTTFILQALARYGRFDAALDLIRERWGGRMLANGATSTWEEWGCNGGRSEGSEYAGYMRSQSHPWAAYPAEFLLTQLPRLTILEPGARRIRLDPVRTPFAYRLSLRLPTGRVGVDWDGRDLQLDADEPIALEG